MKYHEMQQSIFSQPVTATDATSGDVDNNNSSNNNNGKEYNNNNNNNGYF